MISSQDQTQRISLRFVDTGVSMYIRTVHAYKLYHCFKADTCPSSSSLSEFNPPVQVHPTCLSAASSLPRLTLPSARVHPTCPSIPPRAQVYPHLAEYIPCAGRVHPICLSSPHLSECLPPVQVHPHLSEYLPPAQVHPTHPSISHLSEFTLPV